MIPVTLSAPRSPRLVTVTVGEASSELRRPPVRARCTRSRIAAISSGSGSASASRIAGATSPPPRSEIAQPTWTPSPGAKRAVDIGAVELRHLAQRQRGCLQQQHRRQQPVRHRAGRVEGFEPGQRRAEIDRVAQIIMRDLALRAPHRGGDRLAHFGRIEPGATRRGGWARRPGGLGGGPRSGGQLDIGQGHRAVDPGAGKDGGIDAEFGGTPPRRRGDFDACRTGSAAAGSGAGAASGTAAGIGGVGADGRGRRARLRRLAARRYAPARRRPGPWSRPGRPARRRCPRRRSRPRSPLSASRQRRRHRPS